MDKQHSPACRRILKHTTCLILSLFVFLSQTLFSQLTAYTLWLRLFLARDRTCLCAGLDRISWTKLHYVIFSSFTHAAWTAYATWYRKTGKDVEEVIVTCFRVLSQHLPNGSYECADKTEPNLSMCCFHAYSKLCILKMDHTWLKRRNVNRCFQNVFNTYEVWLLNNKSTFKK